MSKMDRPETHIREASPADVLRLSALVQDYWRFEGIGGFQSARVAALLEWLVSNRKVGLIWVAETGGTLVGYLIAVWVASLEYGGLTAEIDEFFIQPEARGQGIGRQLLVAAEHALEQAGCVRVQLQLGLENEQARSFYSRHRYRRREGFELLEKELG